MYKLCTYNAKLGHDSTFSLKYHCVQVYTQHFGEKSKDIYNFYLNFILFAHNQNEQQFFFIFEHPPKSQYDIYF